MSREEPIITPWGIVLTLVLMGISTLFAGMCAAYLYTLFSTGIEAPRPPITFLINIPVLYMATRFLKHSMLAFDDDALPLMSQRLNLCLALTVVFIGLQILGWIQFFRHIPIAATQARSFLFVLSGLHLVHVMAGLPILVRFMWLSTRQMERLQFPIGHRRGLLKGLIRYWNYLDILWILLVVMLFVAFALKWL